MKRWILTGCLSIALLGIGRDAVAEECGIDCEFDLCSSDRGLFQYSPTMVRGLAEVTVVSMDVVRIDRTFGVVPEGYDEGTEHDAHYIYWYDPGEAPADRVLVFFIAGREGQSDWTRLLPLDAEGRAICREGTVEVEEAAAIALTPYCFDAAVKAGLAPCNDGFGDDDDVVGCGCPGGPWGVFGLIGVVAVLERRRKSS